MSKDTQAIAIDMADILATQGAARRALIEKMRDDLDLMEMKLAILLKHASPEAQAAAKAAKEEHEEKIRRRDQH